MKATAMYFVILLFLSVCTFGESVCTLVADGDGVDNLHESVCYLSCLSNALNKLYSDGEQKLIVNEEIYANTSRILDDMEGRTDESTKYLSVISSVMDGKHDNLEKLISYGNEMGDIVAKVGGLFAEVNESVRVVRKVLPTALIKASKYYTAIAEIERTVWDDVKALESGDQSACIGEKFKSVAELKTMCGDHTCPLTEGLNDRTLKRYGKGCLEINVLNKSGSVIDCINLPRNNLYKNGAGSNSSDLLKWKGEFQNEATRFQLTVEVQNIFGPLLIPFAAGKPPYVLIAVMSNITSLHSQFNKAHNNFTSLLFDIDVTGNVNNTNSTI
ncbi:expression site-associated gene 1 (ESAG1) protein, putative [Trypanosoma equiperdum]|uniref:Expression site-associated gene 1 (ESAG1) protein, putative n=1 Tax=Trypanosoma equiperdum TaxID=5694 RepID=A0A1G4I0V2_TRYEQ|nr:expression site-associated gene 1 (ESAG1) protein, putative [Trypanosoma equiperdum]